MEQVKLSVLTVIILIFSRMPFYIKTKNIHKNHRVHENQACKKSTIVILYFFVLSELHQLTHDCLDLSS